MDKIIGIIDLILGIWAIGIVSLFAYYYCESKGTGDFVQFSIVIPIFLLGSRFVAQGVKNIF